MSGLGSAGPRGSASETRPFPQRLPRGPLSDVLPATEAGTLLLRPETHEAQSDPRPGPPLLAAGPRSAFSAHSGPPLGRFRFRFLAESVEENESGSVQSLRGSRRARGAPCGAASLERASRSLSPHPARWR
ncbi:hypothetical protein AB1E18_005861 [Capra hircus]